MAEKKTGELVTFASGGKLALSKKERAAALRESANAGGSGSGGDKVFLNFSGQGADYKGWTIGRDRAIPDPDAVYIMDPDSVTEGWKCWKGGGVVGQYEWLAYERATKGKHESELEDHGPYPSGDGWAFQMGISMFDVDEVGKQIVFSTTSASGRNTMRDLLDEMSERIEQDQPEVPVIMLSSESFVAHGKSNGKPTFDIQGWVTPEEVHAFMKDEGADVEELLNGEFLPQGPEEEGPAPKPTRRRRAKADA